MEIINALGLVCPQPVIEAKKAIAKLKNGKIKILVDNQIATENLNKMCIQKNYDCKILKIKDREYSVEITVGDAVISDNPDNYSNMHYQDCAADQNSLVVAIGKDKMGSGDDKLGAILIKGFIYSLANLESIPQAMLFFNSGVKLVVQNSNVLDDLKTLTDAGCSILVCGTCADFYGVKDKIKIGEIVNMYTIVEKMHKASKIINM